MKPKDSGRRSFLKHGAALAGLAVGAAQALHAEALPDGRQPAANPRRNLHAYGERSRFETAARLGSPGLYGILTPPDITRISATEIPSKIRSRLHYDDRVPAFRDRPRIRNRRISIPPSTIS